MVEPEGLRGLEVDDQLELHWLLYGQVGGFGALSNPVHVGSEAPGLVHDVIRVGHERPGLDRFAAVAHQGEPARDREVHDAFFVRPCEWPARHVEAIRTLCPQRCEDALEILRPSDSP